MICKRCRGDELGNTVNKSSERLTWDLNSGAYSWMTAQPLYFETMKFCIQTQFLPLPTPLDCIQKEIQAMLPWDHKGPENIKIYNKTR